MAQRTKKDQDISRKINIPEMEARTNQWAESIRLALEDPHFKKRKEFTVEIQKGLSESSKTDFSAKTKSMGLVQLRTFFFQLDPLSPERGMAFNKIKKYLNKEIQRKNTEKDLVDLFPLTFTGTKEYNLLIKKIALNFFQKK